MMKVVRLASVLVAFCLLAASTLALAPPSDKGVPNAYGGEGFSQANMLRDPSSPPIRPAHAGSGFALGTNGTHLLRIEVARVRVLQPSVIRRLLEENRSLEEIKAEITKDKGVFFINRGHMRLGEEHYGLVDVNLTNDGTNTSLEAGVVEFHKTAKPNGRGEIVGHIKTRTTSRDGAWISEGELVMSRGRYLGDYRVLLEMSYPVREHAARGRR